MYRQQWVLIWLFLEHCVAYLFSTVEPIVFAASQAVRWPVFSSLFHEINWIYFTDFNGSASVTRKQRGSPPSGHSRGRDEIDLQKISGWHSRQMLAAAIQKGLDSSRLHAYLLNLDTSNISHWRTLPTFSLCRRCGRCRISASHPRREKRTYVIAAGETVRKIQLWYLLDRCVSTAGLGCSSKWRKISM